MVLEFLVLGAWDVFHPDHLYFFNALWKLARVREGKGTISLAIGRDSVLKKIKEKLVFTESERVAHLKQLPLIKNVHIGDLENGLEGIENQYEYVCLGDSEHEAKIKLLELSKKRGFIPLYITDQYTKTILKTLVQGKEHLDDEDLFLSYEIKALRTSSSSLKRKHGKKALQEIIERTLDTAIFTSTELYNHTFEKMKRESKLSKREKSWAETIQKILTTRKNQGNLRPYQAGLEHHKLIISDSLKDLKDFYYS